MSQFDDISLPNPLIREKNFYPLVLITLFLLPTVAYFTPFAGNVITVTSFLTVYLIAAQALNLQVGYTGLLNLGSVAFVGVGAYVAAIILSVPGGHTAGIRAMTTLNNGATVITADAAGRVYSWDSSNGAFKQRYLTRDKKPVTSLAVNPASTHMVVGSESKSLYVFDLKAPLTPQKLPFGDAVSSVCFDSAGSTLYVAKSWGELKAYPFPMTEASTGTEFSGLRGGAIKLRAFPDNQLLTVDDSGAIKLWNTKTRAVLKAVQLPENNLSAGAVSNDLKFAAAATVVQKTVKKTVKKDGKETTEESTIDVVTVRVYDFAKKAVIATFTGPAQPVADLSFSPDGQRLAIARRDGKLSLFNYLDAASKPLKDCVTTLSGHEGSVNSTTFSADGKMILTASGDQTTRLWTLNDQKSLVMPRAKSALIAFNRRNLPSFKSNLRWPLFFLDSNFLAYMMVIPPILIVSILLGLAIGIPTLRLTGDYFAIVTLGLAEIIRLVAMNEIWLTGGSAGIKDLPPLLSFARGASTSPIARDLSPLYFGVTIFAVSVFVMVRLRDSRMGRAFMAIRDNEMAAQSNGINVARYKIYSFLISSCLSALAGLLLVARNRVVDPDQLNFMESVLFLCCIVLGGLGSIRGAIVGGIIVGGLGEIMRQYLDNLDKVPAQFRYVFFGIILILVMRFRPEGLIPASVEEAERGHNEKSKNRDVTPDYFDFTAASEPVSEPGSQPMGEES